MVQAVKSVTSVLAAFPGLEGFETAITRRRMLHPRNRRWADHIRPMLADSVHLVVLVRPTLERHKIIGPLRLGAVAVEFQIAMTLRFLAGVSLSR